MLDRFYFNNRYCFTDMNVLVSKSIEFPLSNEEVEEIPVEGRSGNLTRKKGTFKDKLISLEISILATNEGIWGLAENVEEWLTNIEDNRLIFSDRKDKAYRVKRVEIGNILNELTVQGSTKFNFICEPFLTYTNEKQVNITNYTNIRYEGNIKSEPLLELWGSGNISLTINNDVFTVKNVNGYVKIDTRVGKCVDSQGNELENDGGFPTLLKGNNSISKTGNITKILLTPRTSFRN